MDVAYPCSRMPLLNPVPNPHYVPSLVWRLSVALRAIRFTDYVAISYEMEKLMDICHLGVGIFPVSAIYRFDIEIP